MKTKHLKLFITFLTCAISFAVFSSENSAMDEFFAKNDNQKKFDVVKLSGAFSKGKEKMIAMCKKNKQTENADSQLDCACYKEELQKISDREFYFGSVLAYEQFLERTAASKEKDQSKYEALKISHAKQQGFVARIENKCGK